MLDRLKSVVNFIACPMTCESHDEQIRTIMVNGVSSAQYLEETGPRTHDVKSRNQPARHCALPPRNEAKVKDLNSTVGTESTQREGNQSLPSTSMFKSPIE